MIRGGGHFCKYKKGYKFTKVINYNKIKVEMEDDENAFEEVFAEGLLDFEVRFNIC